jgi:hypothetical protein
MFVLLSTTVLFGGFVATGVQRLPTRLGVASRIQPLLELFQEIWIEVEVTGVIVSACATGTDLMMGAAALEPS